MQKFKPCGHYLIVRLSEVAKEQTSAGGIVLRTKSEDRKREQSGYSIATVESVGHNCWTGHQRPDGEWGGPWCNVGDTIMIAQYAGQGFPVPDDATEDDKKELALLRLIKDDDVLVVVEDE